MAHSLKSIFYQSFYRKYLSVTFSDDVEPKPGKKDCKVQKYRQCAMVDKENKMNAGKNSYEDQSGLRRVLRKGETEKTESLRIQKSGLRGERSSEQGVESEQRMVQKTLFDILTHENPLTLERTVKTARRCSHRERKFTVAGGQSL